MGAAAVPAAIGAGAAGLNFLGQQQARGDAKDARSLQQQQHQDQIAFQNQQLALSQQNLADARAFDEARRIEIQNILNTYGGDILNGTFAGSFNGTDVFGGNVDPSIFSPASIIQGQRDGIAGNLVNLDVIRDLTNGQNAIIDQDFFNRASRFIPKFESTLSNIGDAANSLSQGQLPFSDALDVVADRNNFAGSIGTPGNAGNTTLRDLGLSQLDAITTGNSLLASMTQTASQISPVSARLNPNSLLFDAGVGLDARINAAEASVAPNPTAQGLFELGLSGALGTQGSFIPQNLPAVQPLSTNFIQPQSVNPLSALNTGLNTFATLAPFFNQPSAASTATPAPTQTSTFV